MYIIEKKGGFSTKTWPEFLKSLFVYENPLILIKFKKFI